MTPTSEERREVAERLRKAADFGEWLDLIIENAISGVFGEVRRPIADTLADLIDPTCTVVSERAHTVGFGCEEAGTEFTLSCGHTVIVDGELPPRYCDECGARVVDEDD